MSEPRCAAIGCGRSADTVIDGVDVRTGAILPSAYSCDDPEHQYAIALAITGGSVQNSTRFAAKVKGELARWNAEEVEGA